MSVYTRITSQQLQHLLHHFDKGKLLDFQGIAAGIDNSNYHVSSQAGEFILTLYESLPAVQASTYLQLLSQLHEYNFPCPQPITDAQHNYLYTLDHKPAALFLFISGDCVTHPTVTQCYNIGRHLAQLHRLSPTVVFPCANSKGNRWLEQCSEQIKASLSTADQVLLQDELRFQQQQNSATLPQGLIHADLFRDNVLFHGEKLSGILDFYNACQDTFLLDLAICINDWCRDEQQHINARNQQYLMDGYQSIRLLSDPEKALLPAMLRWAALRFWLSRCSHQRQAPKAEITTEKDPAVFRRLLHFHRAQCSSDNNCSIMP